MSNLKKILIVSLCFMQSFVVESASRIVRKFPGIINGCVRKQNVFGSASKILPEAFVSMKSFSTEKNTRLRHF